jgi:hypothetical protein
MRTPLVHTGIVARISSEEAARRCISASLGGVQVDHHDDGSEPRMHDLEIVYSDRAPGAVEVTAAADADSIELWNLITTGGRRQIPGLTGGWFASLSPRARGQRVLSELPALLKQLEQTGMRDLDLNRASLGTLEKAASALGITRLAQGGTNYLGSIYFTIDLPSERSGGLVDETGDTLASWLSEWLEDPDQVPNLEKLARSGAEERHLFVILPGFAVASFAVVDLLMRSDAPLPRIAPRPPIP